jgi:hypothetical protein
VNSGLSVLGFISPDFFYVTAAFDWKMNINSQRKINILWSGKLRDEKDEAEYI